jgi:hypothetical protein
MAGLEHEVGSSKACGYNHETSEGMTHPDGNNRGEADDPRKEEEIFDPIGISVKLLGKTEKTC